MFVKFPKPNWPKLKTSTKVWIGFFVANVSIAQINEARVWVTPKLVHHPRLLSLAITLLGLGALLHRPQVQKFLVNENTGQPMVPAEPGAQIDDVKVVTKE